MNLLYSLLYTVAFFLCLPYFLIAGAIRGKYLKSAGQRFGFVPLFSRQPSCWVHAVSVGEFLAARPLIRRFMAQYPEIPLYVSTTTVTGQKLAGEHLPGRTFYFPFDWRWSVRKVLRRIKPRLIIVLETEIWPNFILEARQQRIPVVLVNGRLSDRSFRHYFPVRRWLPGFDFCLMQSPEDALRMKSLSDAQVEIMGNIKFDFKPPVLSPSLQSRILEWKGDSLLWICGSTMKGEEALLIDVFRNLLADMPLNVLLAPRHPERFREVADLIRAAHIPCMLRSEENPANAKVMILDSIGELASCYQLADLVFIGGTLLPDGGGHNPIEPAYFRKAIVTGPYYSNFRAIFEEMQKNQALLVSSNLKDDVEKLLRDAEWREQLGSQAGRLVQNNAGATETAMARVREFLKVESHAEQHSELPVR